MHIFIILVQRDSILYSGSPTHSGGPTKVKIPVCMGKNCSEFEGLLLVAHNSPFEEGRMKEVFKVYQMDYPDYEYYDTLAVSRKHFGCSLPNHKIYTVYEACGYVLENHHHALADAEACEHIVMKIL